MKHGVVEGETGIFPIPFYVIKRGLGRIFGRGKAADEPEEIREMPEFPKRPPDAPS